MKRVLIYVVIAATAAVHVGCGSPIDAVQESPAMPVLLDFPGRFPPCSFELTLRKSPEEWERDAYLARIVNGRVEQPLNIPCVNRAFNVQELEKYALEGDPVATLTFIINRYSGSDTEVCIDISFIRSRLATAFQSPNSITKSPVSRLPEAAYILAIIENYCNPEGDEYDRLNKVAYDLGYDAAAARGILIE